MKLTIVLTRDVENQSEGAQLYQAVRNFMEQFPQVEVRGTVTNHFELEEAHEDPD